jgi:hypothetical protein
MITKISKTEDLNKQLEKEGKITILNDISCKKAMHEMNQDMEETRREYQVKDGKSQASAAKIILTS